MASIFKRGNVYQIDKGRVDGKRVYESLHTSDKDVAEAALEDFERRAIALANGTKQPRVSFAQFEEDYLAYCVREKSRHTVSRDRDGFRALKRYMPVKELVDITPDRLSALREAMKKDGRGAHGINRSVRALKTAMHWAEAHPRYSLVPQNWGLVKSLPAREFREEYLSLADLKSVLLIANGQWRTAIFLMARCGLRPAEAYHLQCENIDLKTGMLRVVGKQCVCTNCAAGDSWWMPKTSRSARYIPLDNDLSAYLAKTLPLLKSDWVISDEDGDRPALSSFLTYVARLIRAAGLVGSAYTLRHTFASLLAQDGHSPKAIADLMGHTHTDMTDRYMKMSPESLRKVIVSSPRLDIDSFGGVVETQGETQPGATL